MILHRRKFFSSLWLLITGITCGAQNQQSAFEIFPNPFHQRAIANYTIGNADTVRIDILDVTGSAVTSLVKNVYLAAGSYQDSLDLKYQAAGSYFAILKVGTAKPVAYRIVKEAPKDTLKYTEVRSFHPNAFSQIPCYERFEIGVRISSELQSRVESFLSAGTGGTLNPYNPDDISVSTTYTHMASSEVFSRNGFYFQDISVKSNIWVKEITEFPFRVRFAPPRAGNYQGKVTVKIRDSLVSENEFAFSVKKSGNPGHIKMNLPLRRMQFENDELCFAIGENIAWADWDYPYNPNFPSGFTNFWEYMSSPRTHQRQRNYIADLADNSGNFVRIRLDPWSVPIESIDKTVPLPSVPFQTADLAKYVNNYHHNQMFMSEMDKTLSICENRGVYIMLNILNDVEMNVNDTSDHSPGSLLGWPRNPYSGLLNDNSLHGIKRFFTDEEAIKVFKNRLQYIEARWGYSTSIAVWQIINETENISGDYRHPKYNYKYWDDDVSFRNDVYRWLCDIRNNLRSYYPPHLVTTGMAGGRGVSGTEAADFLPCLDIVNKHDYTIEFNQKVKKYSARDYNRNQEAIKYYHLGRPFIWGEIGLADGVSGLNVYGNVTYHNSVWASMFSGSIGTVLNFKDWPQGAGYRHRENLKGIKAFSERVNFRQPLVPCMNNSDQKGSYVEYSESKILTVWLKRDDNLLAYGWSRNNSFNWMSETFPNLTAKDQAVVKAATGWDGEAEFLSLESDDQVTKVKNLNPRTKYRIDIYNTWDDYELLETQYQKTDKHGLLSFGRKMPYYVESPWYPDYAFVLTDIDTRQDKMSKALADGIYPVPAQDKITVQANYDAMLSKTVRISDATGRTISREMTDSYEISVEDLAGGFYILEISNGILEQCIKFAIIRH